MYLVPKLHVRCAYFKSLPQTNQRSDAANLLSPVGDCCCPFLVFPDYLAASHIADGEMVRYSMSRPASEDQQSCTPLSTLCSVVDCLCNDRNVQAGRNYIVTNLDRGMVTALFKHAVEAIRRHSIRAFFKNMHETVHIFYIKTEREKRLITGFLF
jgi:hypothetical protein